MSLIWRSYACPEIRSLHGFTEDRSNDYHRGVEWPLSPRAASGVHEIDRQTGEPKEPPERRLQPGLAAPPQPFDRELNIRVAEQRTLFGLVHSGRYLVSLDGAVIVNILASSRSID